MNIYSVIWTCDAHEPSSRSILGSPGGSSTVQGQCEQVLFHLDQLLHAFLNTGEMALDSLP